MPERARKKPAAEKKSTMTKKEKATGKPASATASKAKGGEKRIDNAPARAAAGEKKEPKKEVLSEDGSKVESASPDSKKIRALEKQNKQLLVRIRELEFNRTKGDKEETEPAVKAEVVSKESQDILHLVRNLEAQVEKAFSLNQALEEDLADVQAKLVEETRIRSELHANTQLLEAKASLVEQLQDELSFVEQERSETAKKLKENEIRLEQITTERNVLGEQMSTAEARIGNLEQEKVDLEAQVLNLEEKVANLAKVSEGLMEVEGVRDELKQQVKDLTRRINASESSKKSLESDLAASEDAVSELQRGVKKYQENLDAAHTRLTDLSEQLEQQRRENRDLVEANTRLERAVKTLTARNETIGVELEATKKVLHEIHSAATLTTKRIQSRYYKSTTPKKE